MSGLFLLWTNQRQTQMVIQMARTYISTTWNNSDKFGYSGVQQHFKPNGAANPKAYEEKPVEKKAKKLKAPDLRSSAEKAEDRLDARRIQFEKAFEEGVIDFERYNMLLTEWEIARDKLDKKMGIVNESKEIEPSSPSIIPMIEDAAKSFCARNPFAFTVASILFGCGILNIVGFGA